MKPKHTNISTTNSNHDPGQNRGVKKPRNNTQENVNSTTLLLNHYSHAVQANDCTKKQVNKYLYSEVAQKQNKKEESQYPELFD